MINPNDSIRFKNVVSKKYSFYYEDMDKAIEEFLDNICEKGAVAKGPLFYSLNNIPMDKMMNVEFFMPIEQDKFEVDNGVYFHSYFSIENMVSIYICDNFEKNTEVAYAALLNYIDENKLKQVTPIFHVILGDETMRYAAIKIGTISDEKDEKSVQELSTDIKKLKIKEMDENKIDNASVFK